MPAYPAPDGHHRAAPTRLFADNKHVVFGRVLGDSMLPVRKLEAVQTGPNNRPKLPCVISQCGEL